jgi:hypothetical protein
MIRVNEAIEEMVQLIYGGRGDEEVWINIIYNVYAKGKLVCVS